MVVMDSVYHRQTVHCSCHGNSIPDMVHYGSHGNSLTQVITNRFTKEKVRNVYIYVCIVKYQLFITRGRLSRGNWITGVSFLAYFGKRSV